MIENLSQYWDKADGKTKKKILGCIFTEKFEDFDFESCNHIFTPEIESIMLASKVLRKNKNKKEVKNDLLSNDGSSSWARTKDPLINSQML